MRKLVLGILVALVVVSCNQKKIEQLEFQKDSILYEKDSVVRERDYFLEVISEIQANFRQIKEVEFGIIAQSSSEGINEDSRAQIQEDFQLISSKIEENKDRIAQLEGDLKKAQGQAAHYRGLVANLRKDIEARDKEISILKSQLAEKDLRINELSQSVSALAHSKDSLSTLSQKQLAAIKQQDSELNAGWYIIGKKSDLKNKGLKEGILKSARIDRSKFTKTDIREISELNLKTKKAKLYTIHPEASYSLERKSAEDKNLVLKIKDYKSFWANTRILVVEVK